MQVSQGHCLLFWVTWESTGGCSHRGEAILCNFSNNYSVFCMSNRPKRSEIKIQKKSAAIIWAEVVSD